jgi:hypothetical protein
VEIDIMDLLPPDLDCSISSWPLFVFAPQKKLGDLLAQKNCFCVRQRSMQKFVAPATFFPNSINKYALARCVFPCTFKPCNKYIDDFSRMAEDPKVTQHNESTLVLFGDADVYVTEDSYLGYYANSINRNACVFLSILNCPEINTISVCEPVLSENYAEGENITVCFAMKIPKVDKVPQRQKDKIKEVLRLLNPSHYYVVGIGWDLMFEGEESCVTLCKNNLKQVLLLQVGSAPREILLFRWCTQPEDVPLIWQTFFHKVMEPCKVNVDALRNYHVAKKQQKAENLAQKEHEDQQWLRERQRQKRLQFLLAGSVVGGVLILQALIANLARRSGGSLA